MFLLYNIFITLLLPLWWPWMWLRAARRREAPNWQERYGQYPLEPRKVHDEGPGDWVETQDDQRATGCAEEDSPDATRLWIHAVSVGEVLASIPVLRELRSIMPKAEIVLTTTTSSGNRTAREQAVDLYDHLIYFPIDIARFQLSAMQHVQPAAVAIMETELWMNFLWAAKTFDARTLLVNGRISDRSFPRSMRIRPFYRALLRNMDRCLMQTEIDAERIRSLGAGVAEVFGNVKFDEALESGEADSAEWRKRLKIPDDKPVVVVGSTRGEEEEKLVLDALSELGWGNVNVVHAPRHLERVPELAAQVRQLTGSVALRSRDEGGPYIILDTYGELGRVYSVADVVVVGGGFQPLGGQNILQPLAHGKPVIHGPNMNNFAAVASAAAEAGATRMASTSGELCTALRELLENPDEARTMGEAAKGLVEANRGAARRYAQAIADEAAKFTRHR